MSLIVNKRCLVIYLEGTIGCGKSTLINAIKTKLSLQTDIKCMYFPEPVSDWKPYLEMAQKDSKMTAFLQTTVMSHYALVRATIRHQIERSKQVCLFVVERSVYSAWSVFSQDLSDFDKKLVESIMKKIMRSWPLKDVIFHVFFLTGEISVILDRVKQRNRHYEQQHAKVYVELYHKYEKFMSDFSIVKQNKIAIEEAINEQVNLVLKIISSYKHFGSIGNLVKHTVNLQLIKKMTTDVCECEIMNQNML